MGVVKNVMVRAGADFSAITKQANKSKRSMRTMQASIEKSCSGISAAASKMGKAFSVIGIGLSVAGLVKVSKDAKAAYDEQTVSSAKLAQVMRNTMGAQRDEVRQIEQLIDAQERLGVVNGTVQTEGTQELATYLELSSSLKTLIPVMNDMVAQQYGMAATSENAVNIATMLGKVMNGQTSALSRYGYSFTAAQEAVLKFGNEEQRAAVLAEVVTESVGGMNAALAATPAGRLQQVSNSLSKIKTSFGEAVSNISVLFIPALNAACSVLATLATLANKVAQALANVFGKGASTASTVVGYTAAAAGSMKDLGDETKKAGAAAKQSLSSFGFDTLQKLSGNSSGGSGSGAEEAPTQGTGATDGGITETATGADNAGESIGWLEAGLNRLKDTMSGLNFQPLITAFDGLKKAVEPLTKKLFAGLEWAYTNIFEPLARWTVQDVLPAFLRILGGAAKVLSAALDVLKPLASWLWEKFLKPFAKWTGGVIVGVLNGLADVLDRFSGWIAENQGTVQFAATAIAGFFAAFKVAKIIDEFNKLRDAIKVAGGITEVFKKIGKALGLLDPKTMLICAGVGLLIAAIVTLAQNWDKVKEVATTAWNAIKTAWGTACEWFTTTIVEPIKTAWDSGMGAITQFCSDAWESIKSAWESASTWFTTTIIEPIKTAWDSGMSTITQFGKNAWTNIQNAWGAATSWFTTTITEPVKNLWSGAMNSLAQWAGDAWSSIKDAWKGAPSWFKTTVMTPISSGFKAFANGIIGAFEGLVNAAISGVNAIIGAFNKISFNIPDWVPVIGGKSFAFNIPTAPSIALPRLATGAVFEGNNPYMAIVNDQKHGVNVESPLSTIVDAMMIALRSSNYGDNVEVNVKAEFEGQLAALARVLRPHFEADARRVGNRASAGRGMA